MRLNSNDIIFLTGNPDIVNGMEQTPALPIFSDKVMHFLGELSKALFKDERAKKMQDVLSFAYWIRKASLEGAQRKYTGEDIRLGRGVAVHFAPSNVPVNFAVSMTSSLLAGNPTVIRVSNKKFDAVDIIVNAINDLLDGECKDMREYLCIIRYEHNEQITQELSSLCDVRVIWGGDNTIAEIREAVLPPRSVELTFADRFSLSVINSDAYLASNPQNVARGFYTDTYYIDQNACSSPRLVVWTGSSIQKAKDIFWAELDTLVQKEYELKPKQSVDKLLTFSLLGMQKGDCICLKSKNNRIVRIQVKNLTSDLIHYTSVGGGGGCS